jgi:hypothetical protein
MATVACKCGEKFHPSPEHYGKEVRCRRCGRMVTLTPDPAFETPPPPKSAPFTHSFHASAPPKPTYTYTPPEPPQPPPDPNAPPPGLHPEIRKMLIYAFVAFALIGFGLIFSAIRGARPTEATPPPVAEPQ